MDYRQQMYPTMHRQQMPSETNLLFPGGSFFPPPFPGQPGGGQGTINQRVYDLERQVDRLERQVQQLEREQNQLNRRVRRLENRWDHGYPGYSQTGYQNY